VQVHEEEKDEDEDEDEDEELAGAKHGRARTTLSLLAPFFSVISYTTTSKETS